MSQETRIQEIKEKFENRFSVLQTELSRELDALSETMAQQSGGTDLNTFASFLSQLRDGYTQSELLNTLLDILSGIIPRVFMLIVKDHTLFGWASRGFSDDFQSSGAKKVKWNVDQFPELDKTVNHQEFFEANYSDLSDISDYISAFDDFSPVKSAFLPVVVRNKVAGMLYLDSGDTMELSQLKAAEMLTHVASLELTMITTKLKKPEKQVEPVSAPKPKEPEQLKPVEPTPAVPVRKTGPIALPSFEDASKEEKKAQRVARVLISDLILYNEDKVNEGRLTGGLYQLLKEDIDRSYEHYQSRTKDLVPAKPNFFKLELIKQLAEDDEALLGGLPF